MRFSTAHRAVLLFTLAGLAATGLAWSCLDLAYGIGPVDVATAQSTKTLLAPVHGAFAMLGLLAFGSVSVTHMRRGWRLRNNRWSGAMLVGAVLLLALSAHALYYAVSDEVRILAACIHIGAGIAGFIAFVLHSTFRLPLPAAALRPIRSPRSLPPPGRIRPDESPGRESG